MKDKVLILLDEWIAAAKAAETRNEAYSAVFALTELKRKIYE